MHTVTDATHNPASAEGLGLARIILFIILIYTLTKQLNLKCVLLEKNVFYLSYSLSAASTGLMISMPPSLIGRAKSLLCISDTFLPITLLIC